MIIIVEWKCSSWNIYLLLASFFISSLSLVPYIFLLLPGHSTRPGGFDGWEYPILRIVGSVFHHLLRPIDSPESHRGHTEKSKNLHDC